MNYNIIRKDISNGLRGNQISSMGSGNYLILRYAPPGANVKVRLGSNTAQAIDLIQDDSIEGLEVTSVYVEADAVPGEHIIFAQAKTSKDFRINPAPAIKNIDVDNFFMPKSDATYTIAPGATQSIDVTEIKAIRFYASDEVQVSLNNSGVLYPMLEDEIFTRDLDSVEFKNTTASNITLVVWSM